MPTLDESMSEDLISRDAVLDACSQSINILDAMSRIEDLPSVTPKQRTGHWIKDSQFTKPYCSECGTSCFGLHGFDYMISPYCPSCGAKMIDPQESEEGKS